MALPTLLFSAAASRCFPFLSLRTKTTPPAGCVMLGLNLFRLQGEVQPGEQLLQNTLDVWSGPSMIITGDDDPTVPTQVRR